ncbi:MAG: hypothetical protein M3271_08850, partial [Actinomycetota bacterium]|nr:hypothetical protein [Actinomycetota bacterium]
SEGGESVIEAEISPPGTPGSFRGPATHDDECEQPSHPDGFPAAGNCISRPLVAYWEVPPPPALCSDGVDNDGDGYVDVDDPQCAGPWDESEAQDDPPLRVHHDRSISLRFSDWKRDRMVVFGRLTVPDGAAYCAADKSVFIERRRRGRWVSRAVVMTNPEGWYVAVLDDRPGRYRAIAPRRRAPIDGSHVCRRTALAKTHRHA